MVQLKTFGYRYTRTEPVGADLVLDARCLQEDPAEHQALRLLTGQDQAVRTYLDGLPDVQRFVDAATAATRELGSNAGTFTVAVACHSGRHRSVYIADAVAKALGAGPAIHLDMLRQPTEDHAPDFV